MKYMLLIHQGDTPTPRDREVWARLSEWMPRAELLGRLGRIDEARAAYERALELVHSEPEQRFLERRLAELP